MTAGPCAGRASDAGANAPATPSAARPEGLVSRGRRRVEALAPYLFISPALAGLFVFRIVPIFVALLGSLFSFQLIGRTREFVGLGNFERLLGDDLFWRSLLNTVVFVTGVTAIQVVLSLGLAVLLTRQLRGMPLFRTLIFVPVVISMVVASSIWKLALDSNSGLINSLLGAVGLPRQPFLTSAEQALPAVMAMTIWKGIGYWMILFIAGLKAIPETFYEAATVDGASAWQRFSRITLPLLRRPLAFVVVADTAINMLLFAPVFLMTRGGPSDSSNVLMYMIYNTAFAQGRMGYAATIAVVLLIVSAVIIGMQLRFLRSDTRY
jgi:ABC-type sugar transport system permease subunit